MNLPSTTDALRPSDVEPCPDPSWRQLLPGQKSRIVIFDTLTGAHRMLYETDESVVEAPNWSPNGSWLVFNCDGLLYRLKVDGSAPPELIPAGEFRDSNNDHVLSPDGCFIYASSEDGHLYRVPMSGGDALRVSNESDGLEARYLHGISPDGSTLTHIGVPAVGNRTFNAFALSLLDGSTQQLTHSDRPHDGAEYSPDGEWIYFNSERESPKQGHSQLFRMRPDGQDITQLTFDDRVNWFPHLSPDGNSLVYLSYEPGVIGHPANKPVQIRMADPEGKDIRILTELHGGQGTINVNSWAPDGRHFAYVAYPVIH